MEQIDALQRPLTMEEGGVVLMDLLWSDPTTNDGVEGVQPSPRGPGLVTFGPDRVKEFCKVRLRLLPARMPPRPAVWRALRNMGLEASSVLPSTSCLACLCAHPARPRRAPHKHISYAGCSGPGPCCARRPTACR